MFRPIQILCVYYRYIKKIFQKYFGNTIMKSIFHETAQQTYYIYKSISLKMLV